MRMQMIATSLSILLASSGSTRAQENAEQPTGGPDVDSAVYEVLEQADQAIKNLKSISYNAFFEGTGSVAIWRPSTKGHVLLARTTGKSPDVRVTCVSRSTRGLEGTVRNYDGVIRRNKVKVLNHEKREVITGSHGLRAMGPAFDLIIREFNHPEPFQEEMQASVAILEGRAYVGDELCDVVSIDHHSGAHRRWYFSVQDHLPRRMIRMRFVNDVPGALVLTLTNVEVDVELASDAFRPENPEGYAQKRASPSQGLNTMYLAPEPKRDGGKRKPQE
ncbi:MAG: hypothetical protein O7G85_17790 [Planctomycetota bacterium]|nr:hypothetical protein [Planctomycetota bacterium]